MTTHEVPTTNETQTTPGWLEVLDEHNYLRRVLAQQEKVHIVARQHKIFLATATSQSMMPIIFGAVFIALALLGPSTVYTWSNMPAILLQYVQQPAWALGQTAIGGILFIGGVCWMVWQFLNWQHRQYVVTDRRVLHIYGVLSKQCIDSSLIQVNDCKISQSWVGLQLDYGDITVFTASEMAVNLLPCMQEPLQFRHAIDAARQALPLTHGKMHHTAPPPTTTEQVVTHTPVHPTIQALEQIQALSQNGMIGDIEQALALWNVVAPGGIQLPHQFSLNHQQAMQQSNTPANCTSPMQLTGVGYLAAHTWVFWICHECARTIATVEGMPHPLNILWTEQPAIKRFPEPPSDQAVALPIAGAGVDATASDLAD